MANGFYENTQVPIYHIIPLTPHKPEIDRILRAVSTPVITRMYSMHKKIACSGYVQVDIEYAACSQEYSQSVHLFPFKIPFAGLARHRRARKGNEAKVVAAIELQAFELIDRHTVSGLLILKLLPLKLAAALSRPSFQLCHTEHIRQLAAETDPSATQGSGCPVFRPREPEPKNQL